MDFMHISGQKEGIWNTLFSIFERWRAPQTSWSPGKLPPLPLSTGLPVEPSSWSKRADNEMEAEEQEGKK